MYETQMKNWIIIILGESQDFCTIYSIMSWIWIFPPSHQEFLQERLHPSDPRGGDASSYARIRWVLGESHLPLKAEGQGHPNQENPRENHQKSIKQTWKPWENHQQPWKNHQKPLKRPSKTIEKKHMETNQSKFQPNKQINKTVPQNLIAKSQNPKGLFADTSWSWLYVLPNLLRKGRSHGDQPVHQHGIWGVVGQALCQVDPRMHDANTSPRVSENNPSLWKVLIYNQFANMLPYFRRIQDTLVICYERELKSVHDFMTVVFCTM